MAEYTYDPTQGKVVLVSQARVVTYITNNPDGMPATPLKDYNAISTEGDEVSKKQAASSAAPKTSLASSLDAIANRLKETKAAYYTAINNKESSTIINRLKAAFDEAQKAYSLSQPQRGDITAAKEEMAYALREPYRNDMAAAAAKTVTPTPKPSIYNDDMTPEEIAETATDAATDAAVAAAEAGAAAAETAATAAAADTAESAETAEAIAASAGYTADDTDEDTDEEIIEEVDLVEVSDDDVPDDGEGNAPARYNLDGSGEDPNGDDNAADVTGSAIYTAPDGKIFTNLGLYNAYIDKLKSDEKRQRGQSAYELLYEEFDRYGLASLVTEIEEFIKDGLSKAELTLKLRGTKTYQTRFAANADRIKNGLAAISEAEYIGLEDQYQNIMRNYGLPESYYARSKDKFGTQEGFQKFIANDVSATELEDRIMTAQKRILFANPEVGIALKTFYPDITNGDLLAYALDPTKGMEQIKRRITAAEVGSSAVQLGLTTNVTDAEYLARYGVTKETAQQGYGTIAGGLQRGSQLASIYGQDPYTQTTAEREVFAVPGAAESKAARQKITGLEKATFGGQTGMSSTALARDRAGAF